MVEAACQFKTMAMTAGNEELGNCGFANSVRARGPGNQHSITQLLPLHQILNWNM